MNNCSCFLPDMPAEGCNREINDAGMDCTAKLIGSRVMLCIHRLTPADNRTPHAHLVFLLLFRQSEKFFISQRPFVGDGEILDLLQQIADLFLR